MSSVGFPKKNFSHTSINIAGHSGRVCDIRYHHQLFQFLSLALNNHLERRQETHSLQQTKLKPNPLPEDPRLDRTRLLSILFLVFCFSRTSLKA